MREYTRDATLDESYTPLSAIASGYTSGGEMAEVLKRVVDTLNSVPEAGQRLGVKDTTIKKLCREGKLLSVKVGDRRLIPTSAIDAYIQRLITEANADRGLETA